MANIQNELNNIKNALFGQEVRGSIHDGIDAINKEVESTTSRQVDLESTFDQLVINAGNSNAEIVDARVKADGTSYSKLGDRLDSVDSQLEQKANKFNTVKDMKEANVKNNDVCMTTGFYEANDGGDGFYLISENIIDENMPSIELNNGLFANLIVNDLVNIRQLGARDLKHYRSDIRQYLDIYFKMLDSKKVTLYIPYGVWSCSDYVLYHKNGFNIIGDEGLLSPQGTIITNYNTTQNFVWQVGKEDINLTSSNINGITFSTANYLYNNSSGVYEFASHNKIIDSALKIVRLSFSNIDLSFYYVNGNALSIQSSWEVYFKKLFFRVCMGVDTPVMKFGKNITGNISACTFENVMFEYTEGDLIKFECNCAFNNNLFKSINFEDNGDNLPLVTSNLFNNESATKWAIINYEGASNKTNYVLGDIFDNIFINNFSMFYHEVDGKQYCYDIIANVGENVYTSSIFNTIAVQGIKKKFKILSNKSKIDIKSSFQFNNFICSNEMNYPAYFDIYDIPYIQTNLKLNGYSVNSFYGDDIVTPFFKYGFRLQNANRGYINYDSECLNNSKLCLKPNTRNLSSDTRFMQFYKTSNKIKFKIRAKVASGETLKIRAVNSLETQYNCTMLGSGEYKWYEFETDFSQFDDNLPIVLDTYPTNYSVDSSFDCFRIIDLVS